jgi:hypothetical protein
LDFIHLVFDNECALQQPVTCIFLLIMLIVFDRFSDAHVSAAPQFESGYFVETLAEGDKLSVTPHTIRVSPVEGGELLAVDAAHSSIVRITPPLSECMFFFRITLLWFFLCSFFGCYTIFVWDLSLCGMSLVYSDSTWLASMAQPTINMVLVLSL